MADKEWPMAFGERSTNPNPAVESMRQAQADKQVKQTKRDDELAEIEHKRKLAEEEAKAAEAQKKKEEAAGGGPKQPLTFKPVEIDIHAGEKAAEERAKAAEGEAQRQREGKEKVEDDLAAERTKRLEDKISQLSEDIKKTIAEGTDKKTLTDKIAELEETATKLGYTKGGTPQVPPDVQIQLQQMQNNLQIRLAEMKEDSDRRDKEWQLTLRKWDEEKEMKRAELAQKAEAEKGRMEFLNTAIKRLGGAIATTVKGGGGVSAEAEGEKTFYIEAGQGEEGETACPKCEETIFIAPDATQVICSSCGLTAEVRRTPTKAKAKSKGE